MKFKKGEKVEVKGFYEKDYPLGGVIVNSGYVGLGIQYYGVKIITRGILGWFKYSLGYHLIKEEDLSQLK